MVKFMYTVFIGILLAALVGVGIAAFYTKPVQPEYPESAIKAPSEMATQADFKNQHEDNIKQAAYQKASELYNRNVALLAVAFSLVILSISLTVLRAVSLFADGVLLGGTITLVYGIIRSFGSGQQKFMFIMVAVGLVVSMALGYIKIVKPDGKLHSGK